MFSEQGFPRGFQIRSELFRLTRSHLINANAKYVIPSGDRDLTNVVRSRAGETTSKRNLRGPSPFESPASPFQGCVTGAAQDDNAICEMTCRSASQPLKRSSLVPSRTPGFEAPMSTRVARVSQSGDGGSCRRFLPRAFDSGSADRTRQTLKSRPDVESRHVQRRRTSTRRRACKLLPLSCEPTSDRSLLRHLARTYAWVGENDLAIQMLESSARQTAGISFGALKLGPDWDSLRGDPRFQKIVGSLAPWIQLIKAGGKLPPDRHRSRRPFRRRSR